MEETLKRTLLFSSRQVERMLDRMAYEVVERNRGGEQLVVLGIPRKGALLAEALWKLLEEAAGRSFPRHVLDVTPYRDDRPLPPPAGSAEDVPRLSLAGKDVLLVDDVLFTGRTVRAALDAVVRYGRPRSIQLAVLVDRGHREYPICPDYVGRKVPTKYSEHIEVVPTPPFAVYVLERT